MKGIDYLLALVIAIISYFNSHNFALSNDLSTSTPPLSQENTTLKAYGIPVTSILTAIDYGTGRCYYVK